MNTFLAHLIVSVSLLLVVSLLTVGACLALHTISKSGEYRPEPPKEKEPDKPVSEVEDLDIGRVFRHVKKNTIIK